MTEQQLNDVWTYSLSESMESAIISDCEGFTVGHITGAGLFPKRSTEKLAWRIIVDHNLGLLAAHAAQREAGEGVPDHINDALDNLAHDNYRLNLAGYQERLNDIALIRAYVARTRQITPQPADAAEYTTGPISDGGMDPRDRQPAPTMQGEPVSAQFRYRRPEKGQPGWSVWQPAAIRLDRPSWEIDSQGWEVEYRLLYTAPQPAPTVQTEPVYLYRRRGLHDFVTCNRDRYAELSAKPHLFETKVLYAALQPAEQQPVGEMISNDGDIYWTDQHPPMGTKLYAAPQPAKPKPDLHLFAKKMGEEMDKHGIHGFEPVVLAMAEEVLGYGRSTEQQPSPDITQLVEALEDLVSEIERTTCVHENIHRGGVLWEICEDCGSKWADDRGGKPEFAWPESVETARNLIHACRKGGKKA